MAKNLNKIESHIPKPLLDSNSDMRKLAQILNGMVAIREEEFFEYRKSFIFNLTEDINIIRRYLDDVGLEYSPENGIKSLQYLYNSHNYISTRKGTRLGVVRLLEALFWVNSKPTVVVDSYTNGQPFLLLDDDIIYDQLINGEDLANEFTAIPDGGVPNDELGEGDITFPQLSLGDGSNATVHYSLVQDGELRNPTLLEGSWLPHKTVMEVSIDVDYTPKTEFLKFVKSIIINYVPMLSPDFFKIIFTITDTTLNDGGTQVPF